MERGQVYVRTKRDGKWEAIDVFDMTEEEFRSWLLDMLYAMREIVKMLLPDWEKKGGLSG